MMVVSLPMNGFVAICVTMPTERYSSDSRKPAVHLKFTKSLWGNSQGFWIRPDIAYMRVILFNAENTFAKSFTMSIMQDLHLIKKDGLIFIFSEKPVIMKIVPSLGTFSITPNY